MLNVISLDYARKLFKLKVYESDGAEYEKLFTRIMVHTYPSFQQVKPQGVLGDGKNDGYISESGVYFQVYAPERLDKNSAAAAKKLEETMPVLISKWPVRKFYYVLNDKYNGAIFQIHQCLLAKANEYSIDCIPYVAKDLEDEFMRLDELKMTDIIGPFSFIFEKIDDSLKYSVLSEVICHILNADFVSNSPEIMIPPAYEEKILFNHLGNINIDRLSTGYWQVAVLEQYFENNSQFVRNRLREQLSVLYENAKSHISDSAEHYSDLRFEDILLGMLPERKSAYLLPCFSIMSYFFETCDIFEPPTGE